jgi:ribonucleoside-diphosphate reductase alpha chain
VDPKWLVEAASRRQKWIDQAQSLNIYMGGASGKKLDEVYKLAWVRGLKTTYYLRTMAATHVEKSTVAHGALNAVPSGGDGGAGGMGGATGGNSFGVTGGASSGGIVAAAASASAPVQAVAEEAPQADGPVCMMRPGDPGFEECEACQ